MEQNECLSKISELRTLTAAGRTNFRVPTQKVGKGDVEPGFGYLIVFSSGIFNTRLVSII